MKSEDRIQQEMVQWYRNNYCLKHHKPKHIIFHVPNQGKDKIDQMRKVQIGMYAGISDLIILQPNRTIFIEVKDDKGKQSDKQIEFESDVMKLGFQYYVVRSLAEFKEIMLHLNHE